MLTAGDEHASTWTAKPETEKLEVFRGPEEDQVRVTQHRPSAKLGSTRFHQCSTRLERIDGTPCARGENGRKDLLAVRDALISKQLGAQVDSAEFTMTFFSHNRQVDLCRHAPSSSSRFPSGSRSRKAGNLRIVNPRRGVVPKSRVMKIRPGCHKMRQRKKSGG